MQITSNDFEYSRTIERANGVRLDFSAFREDKDFVIGATDQEGEPLQEILLSAEEVKHLLQHLLDTNTIAALS